MPHLFLKTTISPTLLTENWQEKSFTLGNVLIKIRQGYLHPAGNKLLFPCLVIEPFHKQWFYLEVRQKNETRWLIRLDPISSVVCTAGVRLALAWFGQSLARFDTNSKLEMGNLADYVHLLQSAAPQQSAKMERLQRKLAAQMRAAKYRSQAKQFFLSLDGNQPPLDWLAIFGNANPVEIEIGPGKGKFLINTAQTQPLRNYLGIEWAGKYLKVLSERLPRTGLNNVRLLVADARLILQNWIAAGSVARLHINYPDPWWKRKHEKHRLCTEDFLRAVENSLTAGGQLLFATDVAELFTEITDKIQAVTELHKTTATIYRQGGETPPGRTNFEIKKWQSGGEIYEATWQKAS